MFYFSRLNKRIFSVLCSVCLVFSMVPISFGAPAAFSDVKGHWAETQIMDWVAQGFISGYEDGSFKPDKAISRVELFALINRSFGFADAAQANFTDPALSGWKLVEVQKAVKAGYIQGYKDGTIRPDSLITRQEMAVVLTRLLGLSSASRSDAAVFSDADNIASWSIGAVGAVAANQLMAGNGDGAFRPTDSMTRAEAVTALEQALHVRTRVYDKAGIYGPQTGTEVMKGNVEIAVAGVTLRNMTIMGKLTFAAGIGDGDADLDHVKVEGNTIVQGGGENSIHLKDSVMVYVIVDKKDGTVRIVAEGSTVVAEVQVKSPVTLEGSGEAEGAFGKVALTEWLPEGSKVTLAGTFESLEVMSSKIEVEVLRGSIGEMTTGESAAGMTLHLGEEARIVTLVLNAAVRILGLGTIENAVVSEIALQGTTFEKEPKTKNGKAATPPSTSVPSVNPAGNADHKPFKLTESGTQLELINGGQKLLFALNGSGGYELTTYVTANNGGSWNVMFDGKKPVLSGPEFDLTPTAYEVLTDTADRIEIKFTGAHANPAYDWSMVVSADKTLPFFKFTIACQLTDDMTITTNEPIIGLWMNKPVEQIAVKIDQGPDSIYGGNNVGLGLPAAYMWDNGKEAVFFLNLTPMEWMNQHNLNGLANAHVQTFGDSSQTGFGMNVLGRTGNTIQAGNMVSEFYLYSAAQPAQRSGMDSIDAMIRTLAPLHPSTAAFPTTRDGSPVTWEHFAEQSVAELYKPTSYYRIPLNLQDPLIPAAGRETMDFLAGKARANIPDNGGFDNSTTNNWLSSMIGYERLNPSEDYKPFLRNKIAALPFFYDPEADMIRWGIRMSGPYGNGTVGPLIGDVEMSWQNLFYNVEALRTFNMMRPEDFHPALIANLLTGTNSLEQLVRNSDYLLPQFYDPYDKAGAIQYDVPSLGKIKEPWQIGTYAYVMMEAYDATGDEAYFIEAEHALDTFFASSYALSNSVYDKTYADPSEFPVTELFGNSYGSAAAGMMASVAADPQDKEKFDRYANYFLDVLMRLTFWYDDQKDPAARTLNNLGLFEPHGGAYNPTPWETIEAYVPLTTVLKGMEDTVMIELLAKLYNLNRINGYYFYPKTWDPTYFGSREAYNDSNYPYMPIEPYYMSENGGHSDYGALYMANYAPYNYLMYEGFATTDDREVMVLNLDVFDNFQQAAEGVSQHYLLFNPEQTEKQVKVIFNQLSAEASYELTISDADGGHAATSTESAGALAGGISFELSPGQIVRVSVVDKNGARADELAAIAQAKTSLSSAYNVVRYLVQNEFRQVMYAAFPDLDGSVIRRLSRYVGSIIEYDNAIRLVTYVNDAEPAQLTDMNDASKVIGKAEYLLQQFGLRSAIDTPADSAMAMSATAVGLLAKLQDAMALYEAGDYPGAAVKADEASADFAALSPLGDVNLQAEAKTYLAGDSGTFTVSGSTLDGKPLDLAGASVAYASSDTAVATIDAATGAMQAVAPGKSVITVSVLSGGVTRMDTYNIEVVGAPSGVTAAVLSDKEIRLDWQQADFPLTGVKEHTIYRDGVAVGSVKAPASTFTDSGLAENTGYTYTIVGTNASGFESPASAAIAAATAADTTAPNLLSVLANVDTATVDVAFDDPLDPATAGDAANYTIPGVDITAVSVGSGAKANTVRLTVYGMEANGSYSLTVDHIANTASAPTSMTEPASLDFVCMPGLEAYWKFDETAGDIIEDTIGSNDGTVIGAERVPGLSGGGLRFGGGTQKAVIPGARLRLQDGYSISFMMKTDNLRPIQKTVLARGDSTSPAYLRLYESFDGQMVQQALSTGYRGGAYQPDNGVWHHIVVVNDLHTITWYADGVRSYQWNAASTIADEELDLVIGNTLNDVEPYIGELDELRIYNRALSDTDIANMYMDDAPPAAPGNLAGAAAGDSAITLTWDAVVHSGGIKAYRIYRNGSFLAEISNTAYSDAGLSSNTEYKYQVSAVNVANLESAKSAEVSVTTLEDTTPPTVTEVQAKSLDTWISVTFDEQVDAASAANTAHYALDGGLTVAKAEPAADGRSVLLTAAPAMIAGNVYHLTVSGIQDIASPANSLQAAAVAFTFESSLLAHWSFDEGSGGIAADRSDNGNDLVVANTQWDADGAGGGTALQFSAAADDTVQASGFAGIVPGEAFTFSVWVRTSTDAIGTKPTKTIMHSQQLWWFVGNAGQMCLYTSGGGYFYDIVPVDDGNWHLATVTYDGSSVRWYIDGEAASIAASPNGNAGLSDAITDLTIGARMDGIEQYDGSMDDIRIYGHAMTAAEVKALYGLNQA